MKVETEFGVALPSAYREFVSAYGDVSTQGILDAIVDLEKNMPDLWYILPPDEVISGTHAYTEAGMPQGHLMFASDSMGNGFCFRLSDCQSPSVDDAPVWFFDHDFVTMERVARGFEELLAAYLTGFD